MTRHLPRAEIADAELLKRGLRHEVLDGRQRRCDRRGDVRRHQIEDVELSVFRRDRDSLKTRFRCQVRGREVLGAGRSGCDPE